ncbi:hypothetical protein GOP47_0011486 [Adiantum capillus-veneris]|uniref:Uncharacterized protein n=1 Tax=Adiantum capillus-veneris TaxID=13818 RepID=A0A9D4UUB4_ADICA|nr:hypothetical protein GOP47_0011486 [Adiantum capillus-veneris]
MLQNLLIYFFRGFYRNTGFEDACRGCLVYNEHATLCMSRQTGKGERASNHWQDGGDRKWWINHRVTYLLFIVILVLLAMACLLSAMD